MCHYFPYYIHSLRLFYVTLDIECYIAEQQREKKHLLQLKNKSSREDPCCEGKITIQSRETLLNEIFYRGSLRKITSHTENPGVEF